MRLLHVYAGNLYGGIESFLVTLARLQTAAPDLVHEFALCFEGRLSRELREQGRPVHDLGTVRVSRPWRLWRARRRLTELLRRERFDWVLCHTSWPHALFAPVVRAARQPLVFWAHTTVNLRHWLEYWASWTDPDLMIANSQYTAATHKTLFRPNVPIEVVYCPVPAPALGDHQTVRQQVRQHLGLRNHEIVIIQVSRLERLKGQSVLIEALVQLRELPNWKCWFVGGAQRPREVRYQHELVQAVRRAGLEDRVHFLGERSDVRELLAGADLYCQPNSAPDSFGLTFIEALYAGLPVVTSAIGGAVEVVTAECGLLVPPRDVTALIETLRGLLVDPIRRAKLGGAGRARAVALCDSVTTLDHLRTVLTDRLLRTRS